MVMMVAVNECCGWNAEGQLGRAVVALECRLHGSFCSMTRLSFIRGQTEEEEETERIREGLVTMFILHSILTPATVRGKVAASYCSTFE